MTATLITEFEFVLPRGLIDEMGQVHRRGVMRLATAKDELIAQKTPAVRKHPEYLMLVMLSQVIVQIGTLSQVSSLQLEQLFTQDLKYLKALYNHLNQHGHPYVATQCPDCNHSFEVEMSLVGESLATP